MADAPSQGAASHRDETGRPVLAAGPHLGRVASFDPARGLGQVELDGGCRYDFHATAIADGSRHIDPGVAVSVTLAPGHRGRYEARSVVSLGPPDPLS
jgi:cold shock CspA family protein